MKLNLKKLKEEYKSYDASSSCWGINVDLKVFNEIIEALEEAVKLAHDVEVGLLSSKDIISRSLVKTGDFIKFLERFE